MKFSERLGYSPQPSVLRSDEISQELRNELWSCFLVHFGRYFAEDQLARLNGHGWTREGMEFAHHLYRDFLKDPIDTIGSDPRIARAALRERFFEEEWYRVYDFLEWLWGMAGPRWKHEVNEVLQKEFSSYRIIDGLVTEITSGEEVASVQQALTESPDEVREHLRQALRLMSRRDAPDFRNSAKESLSVVEAVVRKITGQPSGTLGQLLANLDLHPALKKGFSSLYGFAGDAAGIRHSLKGEDETITADDAKYFLVSCSAFVGYLLATSAAKEPLK